MKLVSLLPSATEIVYALGLGDDLVGVTDECDHPPEAVTKPVVSRSALATGRPLSAREIDEAVRGRLDGQQPLYVLGKFGKCPTLILLIVVLVNHEYVAGLIEVPQKMRSNIRNHGAQPLLPVNDIPQWGQRLHV